MGSRKTRSLTKEEPRKGMILLLRGNSVSWGDRKKHNSREVRRRNERMKVRGQKKGDNLLDWK